MTLLASLAERLEAQRLERLATGRPLQPGDLVRDAGHGFREVVDAGNAGECAEARVVVDIVRMQSERRSEYRD